jgi:hypothetical protein
MFQDNKQDAFEEGREDGRNADFLDEFVHTLGDAVTCIVPETDEHKAYEAGYHKGLKGR